jgi:luciferase-type oxidoreductase
MFVADRTARPDDARGFQRMFAPHRLTLGVFFPIEAFKGDQPTMHDQERLARRAEELGFAALWFRDVPLRDPQFGDVGQVYDPWVYLGWIGAQTQTIALATGSLVLPLRHPLHTAKAAASVDRLTGGRLVLGIASGDRPVEFPAFGVDYEQRAALFRENLHVVRTVLSREFPTLQSSYGAMFGTADLVPKPLGRLPMLVTGHSGQRLDWIAEHSDGWITYPRGIERQAEVAAHWRGNLKKRGTGGVQAVRAIVLCRSGRQPRRAADADPSRLSRRAAFRVPLSRRVALDRRQSCHSQFQVRRARRRRSAGRDRQRSPAAASARFAERDAVSP